MKTENYKKWSFVFVNQGRHRKDMVLTPQMVPNGERESCPYSSCYRAPAIEHVGDSITVPPVIESKDALVEVTQPPVPHFRNGSNTHCQLLLLRSHPN